MAWKSRVSGLRTRGRASSPGRGSREFRQYWWRECGWGAKGAPVSMRLAGHHASNTPPSRARLDAQAASESMRLGRRETTDYTESADEAMPSADDALPLQPSILEVEE